MSSRAVWPYLFTLRFFTFVSMMPLTALSDNMRPLSKEGTALTSQPRSMA